MSCIIDSGFELGCFGTAGIEKVYVATWDAGVEFSFDADEVITGATGAVTGQTYYEMEMDAEYAGFEQTITGSRENGSTFLESNVTLKFANMDKDLIKLVRAMSKAPMAIIMKSNSGEYFYAGVESAGRALDGTLSSGIALGDLNGAELTVNFRSANGIYSLEASLVGTTFITA